MQLSNSLDVNGSVMLAKGTFKANSYTINVAGDWETLSTAVFNPGTSTVIFDGSGISYIHNGNFNNLVLNKSGSGKITVPSGYTVNATTYDWMAGALNVTGGTFTAYDMIDDAILGTITISAGQVHFHQDTNQYLDLRGSLSISGNGELHIYGVQGDVWMPYLGNATLNMSGNSLLYVHDTGIYIAGSNTLTSNISGGTIRTARNFFSGRSDFNPTGGTVEFVGSTDGWLNMLSGTLYNVKINKGARDGDAGELGQTTEWITNRDGSRMEVTRANKVTLSNNLVCNGNPTVQAGTLDISNRTLTCAGNLNVYGTLALSSGAVVQMAANRSLTVNSGGRLQALGTSSQAAVITRSGSGNYALNINSGGTLAAAYTIFEYMNSLGVNIKSGALVDASNSLNNCTFRPGSFNSTLLTVNNAQNIIINGAVFTTNIWDGAYNVSKTLNQGSVNFTGFTGNFGDPSFEQDSYNRIHWSGELLPPVTNLDISLMSNQNRIRLDWIHSIPGVQFRIYKSLVPEGPWTTAGTTSNTTWNELVPDNHNFYRVTAFTP